MLHAECKILVPQPEVKPNPPPAGKHGVLPLDHQGSPYSGVEDDSLP